GTGSPARCRGGAGRRRRGAIACVRDSSGPGAGVYRARRADRVRDGRIRHPARSPEETMGDTLFAKIIRREVPADIVHEDDDVLGFRDVNPQAPEHLLFIPKRPVATLNDLADADATLAGKLVLAAVGYAKAR